jgi:uncharacterized protein YhfF
MENLPIDHDAALAFWNAYKRHAPALAIDAETPPFEYFGDNPELTEALLDLVRHGGKRATATLAAEFFAEGQPLPRIGSHWVACDSHGRPAVVLRTTELRLGSFDSADEQFAYDEAEDDRTLRSWQDGHRRYWQRQCARLGITWDEATLPIVFERFEVAWPLTGDDA